MIYYCVLTYIKMKEELKTLIWSAIAGLIVALSVALLARYVVLNYNAVVSEKPLIDPNALGFQVFATLFGTIFTGMSLVFSILAGKSNKQAVLLQHERELAKEIREKKQVAHAMVLEWRSPNIKDSLSYINYRLKPSSPDPLTPETLYEASQGNSGQDQKLQMALEKVLGYLEELAIYYMTNSIDKAHIEQYFGKELMERQYKKFSHYMKSVRESMNNPIIFIEFQTLVENHLQDFKE